VERTLNETILDWGVVKTEKHLKSVMYAAIQLRSDVMMKFNQQEHLSLTGAGDCNFSSTQS